MALTQANTTLFRALHAQDAEKQCRRIENREADS